MRVLAFVTLLALAACGQPSGGDPKGEEGAAAPSGGVAFESEALVGVWSFDRTCASGDGMRLNADGTATFDEWGEGAWSVRDPGHAVLTLREQDPGAGATGRTVTYTLEVTAPVTDELAGVLVRGDAEEVRAIHARRCPEN